MESMTSDSFNIVEVFFQRVMRRALERDRGFIIYSPVYNFYRRRQLMANERTYPILPCAELDESIAFYESLGFKKTYRQVRPNPYAVVALEDIQIHLFGMDGFNPADSYGSVIVAVPDPDSLYHDFAAGLRKTYGKLPVAGIPRILRPRKKYGTVRGFSVVDPGGNWLRIYKLGETEEEDSAEKAEGLAQIIYVA